MAQLWLVLYRLSSSMPRPRGASRGKAGAPNQACSIKRKIIKFRLSDNQWSVSRRDKPEAERSMVMAMARCTKENL